MCLDRLYKYKNNNKPESILKLCLCCCALQTFFSLPCCILSYITYFAILAFHLKEIIVTESLQIAYRSPFICHSHIYCCQHIAPCVAYFILESFLSACVCPCAQTVILLIGFGNPLQLESPLARVAIFAVVIAVFMGASRSALAFIYDSQKGHKLRERGWSLWLPLAAIVRPCLAHPLLRAGIPSLITGHPPRCRSNAAIKAVWESGAFVQLECSAINRLRPKVINCVTKEATATTGRGRIGKASARSLHRLHLRGLSL